MDERTRHRAAALAFLAAFAFLYPVSEVVEQLGRSFGAWLVPAWLFGAWAALIGAAAFALGWHRPGDDAGPTAPGGDGGSGSAGEET